MNDIDKFSVERACERLVYSYARDADFGKFESAAQHYAVDGRLIVAGKAVQGHTAIRDRLAGKPTGEISRHLCTNVLIEVVDSEHATGSCCVAIYRTAASDSGPPYAIAHPFLVGHYDDRFVKTADGWKFSDRKLTTTFRRA